MCKDDKCDGVIYGYGLFDFVFNVERGYGCDSVKCGDEE